MSMIVHQNVLLLELSNRLFEFNLVYDYHIIDFDNYEDEINTFGTAESNSKASNSGLLHRP